jgi:hypothetical protein
MKIEQNNIKKIQVTEIKGLDPISIYLEDFEPKLFYYKVLQLSSSC